MRIRGPSGRATYHPRHRPQKPPPQTANAPDMRCAQDESPVVMRAEGSRHLNQGLLGLSARKQRTTSSNPPVCRPRQSTRYGRFLSTSLDTVRQSDGDLWPLATRSSISMFSPRMRVQAQSLRVAIAVAIVRSSRRFTPPTE